jgi:hypothetical protein
MLAGCVLKSSINGSFQPKECGKMLYSFFSVETTEHSLCLLPDFSDLHSLRGHKGAAVRSIEFYPMEGYMASTSVDCTVKVGTSGCYRFNHTVCIRLFVSASPTQKLLLVCLSLGTRLHIYRLLKIFPNYVFCKILIVPLYNTLDVTSHSPIAYLRSGRQIYTLVDLCATVSTSWSARPASCVAELNWKMADRLTAIAIYATQVSPSR